MAWSRLAHIGSTQAASPLTTSGIDTTGADLLVAIVYVHNTNSPGVVSDSKGNSWSYGTTYGSANGSIRIAYCVPASVGSGHTFTNTFGALSVGIEVFAFSGANATPFDVENGLNNDSSVATFQPGSVTPSQANSLIIAGVNWFNTVTSPSIDSGFTISDYTDNGSTSYYGASAYLEQGAAASVNPTWSWTTTRNVRGAIMVFKPAAGAGGGPQSPGIGRLMTTLGAG